MKGLAMRFYFKKTEAGYNIRLLFFTHYHKLFIFPAAVQPATHFYRRKAC